MCCRKQNLSPGCKRLLYSLLPVGAVITAMEVGVMLMYLNLVNTSDESAELLGPQLNIVVYVATIVVFQNEAAFFAAKSVSGSMSF